MTQENAIYSIWNKNRALFSPRPGSLSPEMATQMAANMLCPGPSYYYLCELGSPQFIYISEGIRQVLGVDPATFQVPDFIARLHPEDVPFMARCEEIATTFFMKKIPPEKIMHYKASYTLRVRRQDGDYRLLLHQAMAIEQDGFGRMSRILGVHTDIGHLLGAGKRCVSFIGLQGEPSYLNIDADKADDPFGQAPPPPFFSKRELQVIRLFADGRTAEEVAAALHLSLGTVRTHRRNVLEKSGCPNMTALVARCVREGWV